MNEIIASAPETIPSAEVQNLSDYLNKISTKQPELHLSVLPGIVRDCASVFWEFKKMKIDHSQFNKKCKIIDDYLSIQAENQRMDMKFRNAQKMQEIEANRTIELEKINTYKITKLAELEVQREISITDIEHNTQRTLEQIWSNERVRLAEIKADYEKKKRDQEIDLYKFKENLKKDSREFDMKFEAAKREQADRHDIIKELQKMCHFLNKKIVKGRATAEERDYCRYLMDLQIKAFESGFSFTQSLCKICMGEDDD